MYANPSSVGVSLYFAFSRFPQQFLNILPLPQRQRRFAAVSAGLVLGEYLPPFG